MRFCVYKGHPGFRAYNVVRRRGLRVLVTLDGAPVTHCVMADTRRGVVVCDEVDDHGKVVVNARGDGIKQVRRFGRVAVEITR
ncbi:hypothetical protein BBB39_09190 [Bordetella trematum]|uniref:Uncharacterized protein n=1 Tax=Bordetella trematum TaxID=123899 RepID=A0A157QBA0_9BORD|nr:hypothetical protein BBB39_09190 [Bordetella trematum]SAI43027.1 Uncharacterised protein [Bordetella trematum]SAI72222.1 Uncharacterised protein [Bordetella trematum]SUV97925.1 Uncharacterised protein [Bordetella trematum]